MSTTLPAPAEPERPARPECGVPGCGEEAAGESECCGNPRCRDHARRDEEGLFCRLVEDRWMTTYCTHACQVVR